jgi:hypothetical protein
MSAMRFTLDRYLAPLDRRGLWIDCHTKLASASGTQRKVRMVLPLSADQR